MRSPRSKSLIIDIYGAFVRRLGGWLAVADLITLMGDLGVDEPAVRSSVSRMSRQKLLVRSRREGRVGYGLSAEADAILSEGDARIFSDAPPADAADGWVLAVFSVPEEQRDRRHQLRSRLTWLGFGSIGGGVWIAPARVRPRAMEVVDQLDLGRYVDLFEGHYRGFGELEALVARAWDLEEIAGRYEHFVSGAKPVLTRWRRRTADRHEQAAFVDYVTLLHEWRKLPYLDPGLPEELLPPGWCGTEAAELFRELVDVLGARATARVEQVMAGT
jgi:phenylacetic acid degradation operon negative regulatory protein